MRFIGNKENLLDKIDAAIEKHGVKGESFFDFFSGTTSVARFYKKKGLKIFSSDLLYFSYCLQKAYIENNITPKFGTLIRNIKTEKTSLFETPLEKIILFLNNIPPKRGFVYKNYTPGGTRNLKIPRMYFSDENGEKIDAIRIKLEEWFKCGLLNESEYFILLASLIESVPFYANISGVFAAFQKKWDPRAVKPFVLRNISVISGKTENKCFNCDSLSLLEDVDADILYLDPPYNERQYAPNYHLLETIAKYDNPDIKGVTGMRDYTGQKSDFCNKSKAMSCIKKILDKGRFRHLLFSYNSEGLLSKDEIFSVLELYGKVFLEEMDYPRFKSNASTSRTPLKEYLFILSR